MHSLGIIVGHNARSQGAVRRDTGESEFSYFNRMAEYMSEIGENFGLCVRVFNRRPIGYSAEIREVYSQTDEWGAHATIELHFNAAGNPSATGTETLSSGSPL